MDYLFRGIAKNDKVRILAIDAKESIAKICKEHETLPLTTIAFSRFLLAGAIIGALEKGNHGVTMQIHSDGPIKSLFMQATSNGLIRGYVGDSKGELTLDDANLSVEGVVGANGILSITKSISEGKEFTSDVILTESNITKDIAYYFFTSEQIPTIIDLQVNLDDNGEVSSAKGYLIQLLTGYEEEDVEFLEKLNLEKIDNLEENIRNMFPDFKKLDQIAVRDICDCSKEKFVNGLATLSASDLEELASDEGIEVVCQFCSKSYNFSKEEILEIKDKKIID